MRHGSLFSGIGGFDLAAEWMGWENIFHCEWNPFGQKVLKHYWPNAISYEDITKTDFSIHRGTIDILTGGFPCQPYSTAGKRLGKADERHLFPEMLRCIREIKPKWIIGENVRGLVSWNGGMVFHEVYDDLEREGYEVQSFLIPAASVNAPHRRDRIWFVAYSNNKGKTGSGQVQSKNGEVSEWNNDAEFSDTNDESFADSESSRKTISKLEEQESRQQIQTRSDIDRLASMGDASDTNNSRLKTFNNKKPIMESKNRTKAFSGNSTESIHTRMWWENFPTVSPICNGDDGISNRLDSITFPKWRNESIKAGGNAIVPQVAYQIFKTIQQYENNTQNQ